MFHVINSPRHGKGLCSTRRIDKDTLIGTFEGNVTMEDGEHVLWILTAEESEFGINVTNNLRYLNDGGETESNCGVYGIELYAERDIHEGEELLIDYGEGYDHG